MIMCCLKDAIITSLVQGEMVRGCGLVFVRYSVGRTEKALGETPESLEISNETGYFRTELAINTYRLTTVLLHA